jgi:hypothetical protein
LEVVQVSTDKSTIQLDKNHSLKQALITVRSVIIRADCLEKIPHLIKVRDHAHGEEFEGLVTISRRPPLCLRCRQVGHIRGQCTAAFCTGCHKYGHREPECQQQKTSYAYGAGVKAVPSSTDDVDMDEANIRLTDEERSTSSDAAKETKITTHPEGEKKSPPPVKEASQKTGKGKEPAVDPCDPQPPKVPSSTTGVHPKKVDKSKEGERETLARSASWGDLAEMEGLLDFSLEGWTTPSPPRRGRRDKRQRERSSSRKNCSLSPSPRSKRK